LRPGPWSADRRASGALPAALLLALCAGCDGPPPDRRATSANSSGRPAAERKQFEFDRQTPGSANQVPALEETPGRLRYRPGCLFLDVGAGEEIGLVVPAEATFDGKRMIGRLTTPDGRPVVREIGQFMSFSGRLIEKPEDGRYSCDTKWVLITDDF
jgi:hypothetical protein